MYEKTDVDAYNASDPQNYVRKNFEKINMDFQTTINQLVADIQAAMSSKPTWTELANAIYDVVKVGQAAAESLQNPGVEKRQFVLGAAAIVFDKFWPMLPMPLYLKILSIPPGSTIVRAVVVQLAGILVEIFCFKAKAATSGTADIPNQQGT